jgi:hypothetical protein
VMNFTTRRTPLIDLLKEKWFFFVVPLISVFAVLYIFHQNQKIIALFDFTYFTDIGIRINNGQIPYRDFPLAANPGSFYIIGIILHFFPSNYLPILIYMGIQSTIIIACTSWILSTQIKTFNTSKMSLALLFFLAPLNIYGIFHQPYYDADSIFFVIVGVTLILFLNNRSNNKLEVLLGVILFLPFFFKQNIGLPWILYWVVVGSIAFYRKPNERIKIRNVFLGTFMSTSIFFSWLTSKGIFDNWWYWTISRPLEMRNSSFFILIEALRPFEKALIIMIACYIILRNMGNEFININSKMIFLIVPLATIVFDLYKSNGQYLLGNISNIGAASYPLIVTSLIIFMFFNVFTSRNLETNQIVILGILVVILTTLLPQGFLGSSNSIWPLLILNLILIVNEQKIEQKFPRYKVIVVASASILLFVVSVMSLFLVRYGWIQPKGIEATGTKSISFMKTEGTFLSDVDIATEIFLKFQKLGKVAVFPGEDPIAFLTGFTPDTDVSASDPTTNPNFYNLDFWLEKHSIAYLIYRTNGQYPISPDLNNILLMKIQINYELIEEIGSYQIFKKR